MIWAWTPEGKRALDAHREAMKTKPLSQEEVDSLPAGRGARDADGEGRGSRNPLP